MFDWRVPVLSITIHGWTMVTLVALWFSALIKTRALRMWSPVVATAAVTISIHLYESVHGLVQLFVDGSVGPVEINLVVLFGVLLFLYVFNKNIQVLSDIRTAIIQFLLFIISMGVLMSTGYFVDYPRNIIFGVEWALSKVAVSVFALSLFWRIRS